MDINDKNLRQVYDKAWAMISSLYNQTAAITQEERYFLLSLLDTVMQGKEQKELLDCLRTWQGGERNEEIDEIVKASILPLDLKDTAAVKQTLTLISDLLAYENNGDAD